MLTGLLDEADRIGVPVVWRELPEVTGGGACCWIDGRPVIYLDPRLRRREKAEVLAHELAHVRRGPLPSEGLPTTWLPVVAREEAACDRLAARSLVDLDALAGVVAIVEDLGGHVTADDIAEEFDVTVEVAARAMSQLPLRAVG